MKIQTKPLHKWTGCRKGQDCFLMYRSGMRLVPTRTKQCGVRGIVCWRACLQCPVRGGAGTPKPIRPVALCLLQQRSFTVQLQCCARIAIQFPVYVLALPYSTALKCRSVPAQLSSRPSKSVSCCSPWRRWKCPFDATPRWNPSSLAVLWLRAESGPIRGQVWPLSSLSLHTDFF